MKGRWPACLVVGLAAFAGGCGTGRDATPAWEHPALVARRSGSSEKRPTLAERLRAIKAKAGSAVWVEARYDSGSVAGWLPDREIMLGGRIAPLGQIRRLRWSTEAEVELSEGTRVKGRFEDLRRVDLTIGGEPHSLDLTRATEVVFVGPEEAERPDLDAMRCGVFPMPARSPEPFTAAQIITFSGWDLPGTRAAAGPLGQLEVGAPDESSIRIALTVENGRFPRKPAWSVQLAAPPGREFGAGDYVIPDAAVTDWMLFNGCHNPELTGKFVVWEFERNGDRANRLAIDFLLRVACEGRRETWCGRIRYHSSFR
jgi:hypothetical protein